MRERAIEQFESIFERASIPVLDILEPSLRRLSVVLTGDQLDKTLVRTARYLRGRFESEVQVHWSDAGGHEAATAAGRSDGFTLETSPFESAAALIGQIALTHSQMVLYAAPENEDKRIAEADALVKGVAAPILLIRRPIAEPPAVFRAILHSLSGNFQQTENFSYSFGLVEDGGALRLLHTVDPGEVAAVREAMKLTTDISEEDEQDVLDELTRRGERYLKAVVAASREQPYEVNYRLGVGDIVEAARKELASGSYGLLVVGHHEEGHSRITAADYQLMHLVREIPVLAL